MAALLTSSGEIMAAVIDKCNTMLPNKHIGICRRLLSLLPARVGDCDSNKVQVRVPSTSTASGGRSTEALSTGMEAFWIRPPASEHLQGGSLSSFRAPPPFPRNSIGSGQVFAAKIACGAD